MCSCLSPNCPGESHECAISAYNQMISSRACLGENASRLCRQTRYHVTSMRIVVMCCICLRMPVILECIRMGECYSGTADDTHVVVFLLHP